MHNVQMHIFRYAFINYYVLDPSYWHLPINTKMAFWCTLCYCLVRPKIQRRPIGVRSVIQTPS